MKNPMDYMNTKEKVLIDKGDLMLMLHTVIGYFYDHNAPDEFVAHTLFGLCSRNMFPQSFMDDFLAFSESLGSEEGKKSVRREAFEHGIYELDDEVGDWIRGMGDDDEH